MKSNYHNKFVNVITLFMYIFHNFSLSGISLQNWIVKMKTKILREMVTIFYEISSPKHY